MRARRTIAGVGVGGLLALGAIASTLGVTTSATAGGPIASIGEGSNGTVVDLLPMRDVDHVETIDVGPGGDPVARVRVGGDAPDSDGAMSVCALCQSIDDDQALL